MVARASELGRCQCHAHNTVQPTAAAKEAREAIKAVAVEAATAAAMQAAKKADDRYKSRNDQRLNKQACAPDPPGTRHGLLTAHTSRLQRCRATLVAPASLRASPSPHLGGGACMCVIDCTLHCYTCTTHAPSPLSDHPKTIRLPLIWATFSLVVIAV